MAGLLFVLYVGGSSLVEAVWRFTLEAPFPLNLVIVGFVALIVLGVFVAAVQVVKVIRSLIVPRSWWEAAYRITRFAAANGLRYGHDDVVSYPGIIFGTGIDRTAERRLTTTAGRRVEIGNYRYTSRPRTGRIPRCTAGGTRDHPGPPAAAPAAGREGQRSQRLRH